MRNLCTILFFLGGLNFAFSQTLGLDSLKEELPYQLRTAAWEEKNGDLSNLTENYGLISATYEKLGDYRQALLYEKKARLMRDSTAAKKSDLVISELRTQYEIEKKEATFSAQQEKLNLQHIFQWLYIGIVVVLASFIISFYRNNLWWNKTNKLLAIKNSENELLLQEMDHRIKNNLEAVSRLLALQSSQINDPAIHDAIKEGQNGKQSIGIDHLNQNQGTNRAAAEMKDHFINLGESVPESNGAHDHMMIESAMNNVELDSDMEDHDYKANGPPEAKPEAINTLILADRFFIRYKDKMVKVLFDSILYVEAERNYCRIITNTKTYLLSMPMKNLESSLPAAQFQRIHRSYLVNLHLVDEVSEGHVYINDKSLPLSHTLKEEFLRRFNMI